VAVVMAPAFGTRLERDDINIFTDALARWVPMKRRFRKLVQLHPKSDVVMNAFARFACLAGDGEQYQKLRPQFTSHFPSAAWSEKTARESCDQKLGAPPLLNSRSVPPLKGWLQGARHPGRAAARPGFCAAVRYSRECQANICPLNASRARTYGKLIRERADL